MHGSWRRGQSIDSCGLLLGQGWRRPRISLDAGSQRCRRVVQSRLRRPDRDREPVGYLVQRQPQVVMEDENRPLLDRQPPEGALQLVAVFDCEELARLRQFLDPTDTDVDGPATVAPRLCVALVDQDPMKPRFEAVRIAERAELPPGDDEGRL